MTTYTLYQDHGHYTEDESLEKMIGLAEEFLGSAEEKTTFTVVGPDEELVAVLTNRRIEGLFVKQEWGGHKNDTAIAIDLERFDATAAVLAMSSEAIGTVEDNSETSDEIGRDHVQWSGPCEVEIKDAILEYFGVSELTEITEDALRFCRNREKTKGFVEEVLYVSVKMLVRIPTPDSEEDRTKLLSDFVDNFDYTFESNTADVSVRSTEINEVEGIFKD